MNTIIRSILTLRISCKHRHRYYYIGIIQIFKLQIFIFWRIIAWSNSHCKTPKITQIRHVEPQKRQYTTTEVGLHLFWALKLAACVGPLWFVIRRFLPRSAQGKNKQTKRSIFFPILHVNKFNKFKFLVWANELYMIFITADVLNSAHFDSNLFCEKFELNSSGPPVLTNFH